MRRSGQLCDIIITNHESTQQGNENCLWEVSSVSRLSTLRTVLLLLNRFELRDEHKAELKEAFDVFDREGTGIIDIRGLRVSLGWLGVFESLIQVILRALGFETEKEELKRLVGGSREMILR